MPFIKWTALVQRLPGGPVRNHKISQSRPPVHKQRLVQLGVAVQSMLKLTKKTLFRTMDRNCLMHLMVLATQTSGKRSQISEWEITKKLTDAWMIYLLAYARCLLLVSFNSVCALNTPLRVWQVAIPKSTVVTTVDSRIYCHTKYILTLGLHIVYSQLVFVYHYLDKKYTYCCK